MYTLENENLTAVVREHGAELISLKEKADGTEYLWDGNPEWWKYSSPVLFPIVGKLKDGKYRAEGTTYELPGHGIGRISDFKLVDKTATTITMALDYSEESLKVYPYKFRLEIGYELTVKEVKVKWRVINQDDKPMYFSIGSHPALRWGVTGAEEFSDCYLEFNEVEDSGIYDLAPGCLPLHTKQPFLKGNKLPLNYEMFKNDCRMFDDLKSDTVTIKSAKGNKSVGIRAKGFPWWGIWTPDRGGAPFLCIEPWHGHADFADFTGDISEKDGIKKLAVKEEFNTEYSIVIG